MMPKTTLNLINTGSSSRKALKDLLTWLPTLSPSSSSSENFHSTKRNCTSLQGPSVSNKPQRRQRSITNRLDLKKTEIISTRLLQTENKHHNDPTKHGNSPVAVHPTNQTPRNSVTNKNPRQMSQKASLRNNNRSENKRLKGRKANGKRQDPKKIKLRRRLLHRQNRHPTKHNARVPHSCNPPEILNLEPTNQQMVHPNHQSTGEDYKDKSVMKIVSSSET